MKQYKFEITINEGNDEFWGSIANKSGCDEVKEMINDALSNVGLYDGDNCQIVLKQFEDK